VLAGTFSPLNKKGFTFTKACTASARSDRTVVGGQCAAVESSRVSKDVSLEITLKVVSILLTNCFKTLAADDAAAAAAARVGLMKRSVSP